MVLAVVIVGLPLLWMLLGSLKTNQEIYTMPPPWLPAVVALGELRRCLERRAVRPLLPQQHHHHAGRHRHEDGQRHVTAYAFAFLRFPRKDWLFLLLLAALMIPDQVTILPNYLTLADVFGQSWINTYQGIVLPGAAIAFGTFLLRQSFLGLPREVLEAAKVDGCGHLRLLWDMVLPLSRPVLVTFGADLAGRQVERLSLAADRHQHPGDADPHRRAHVPLRSGGEHRLGQVMAATLFVIVPLLIIFAWAQRHIIEGIAAGATKG